jgi:hypothetical protein
MSNKKTEINDPRFNKVFNDPIFQEVPKKVKKVQITDDRFKNMFTDNRFNDKLDIDQYGRKISKSLLILEKKDKVNSDLKKYYLMDKDEESVDEIDEEVEDEIAEEIKIDHDIEGGESDTSEEFEQFLQGI